MYYFLGIEDQDDLHSTYNHCFGKFDEIVNREEGLSYIRKGDVLTVFELNSLGRNYNEVIKNIMYLKEHEITLNIIDYSSQKTIVKVFCGNPEVDNAFLYAVEYAGYFQMK